MAKDAEYRAMPLKQVVRYGHIFSVMKDLRILKLFSNVQLQGCESHVPAEQTLARLSSLPSSHLKVLYQWKPQSENFNVMLKLKIPLSVLSQPKTKDREKILLLEGWVKRQDEIWFKDFNEDQYVNLDIPADYYLTRLAEHN